MAGAAARDEQRGVAESAGRLQRRVDNLYAETRHFAELFTELDERLERLEGKSRSWFGRWLARDLDEQVEVLRLETDEAEDRFNEARGKFEAARDELERARGRQQELAAGAADYDVALRDKEDQLTAAGDPRAGRLAEIAGELERQAAVLQETDDLLTSVGWSDRALDTLEHLVMRTKKAALNDLVGGGVLAGKAKYDEMAAVSNAAAYAEQCLGKLKDELLVYGERQSLQTGAPLDSGARFLDVWLDSSGHDVRSLLRVIEAEQRLPRTRRLLEQVNDDLRVRRSAIATTMDQLTAERRRLLAR